MAEFKDYYENHHIPLLYNTLYQQCRKPTIYKRNYIEKDQEMLSKMIGIPCPPVDFDVITEIIYEDEKHFQEVASTYSDEKLAKLIREDEEKIIDHKIMRAYHVEEKSSS